MKLQKMKESEAKEFAKKQQIEIDKKLWAKGKESKAKKEPDPAAERTPEKPEKSKEKSTAQNNKEAGSNTKKVGNKGMKLGAKTTKAKEVKEEAKLPSGSKSKGQQPSTQPFPEEEQKVNPLSEAVSISIEEKLTSVISKDGDIGKFEVKGEIFLFINDKAKADAEISLSVI